MKLAKRIGIFSCCIDAWGGSEELWARSIPYLLETNTDITLYKKKIDFDHPNIKSLAATGVHLKETVPDGFIWRQRWRRIVRAVKRRTSKSYSDYREGNISIENFYRELRKIKPDLMVIAQGINFDGLIYARECLHFNIPYILIVQKAVDFYWPQPQDRNYMTACYQKAIRCYFVSAHNKRLTEEQFGIRISNSSVISNPVKIPVAPLPFPDTSMGFKLACVGRLFVLDKGQDMLLRILSKPHWRERPVHITFVGTGVDEEGLKALSSLLELDNVHFLGHVTDIENLWKTHHALVLPSRSEGLPLSILEAMAAGRPAIVSNAGGNAEIVKHGVTGFVGEACERSFEEAMESAWNKRADWEAMGKEASNYVLNHVPANPESALAEYINHILYEK